MNVWSTMSCRLRRCASSMSLRACSDVSAIGFSSHRCLPALSTAMPSSKCVLTGVAIGDGIDRRVAQQLLKVGCGFHRRIAPLNDLELLRVEIRDRCHGSPGGLGEVPHQVGAPVTITDDAEIDHCIVLLLVGGRCLSHQLSIVNTLCPHSPSSPRRSHAPPSSPRPHAFSVFRAAGRMHSPSFRRPRGRGDPVTLNRRLDKLVASRWVPAFAGTTNGQNSCIPETTS